MSAFKFTDIEKQAIVSLIVEMVNADRYITLEEMYASNAINAELGISDEVFKAGMALDFAYACQVVKAMELERKCFVAQQLIRIMDADGTQQSEHILFERIGQLTGLAEQLGC